MPTATPPLFMRRTLWVLSARGELPRAAEAEGKSKKAKEEKADSAALINC